LVIFNRKSLLVFQTCLKALWKQRNQIPKQTQSWAILFLSTGPGHHHFPSGKGQKLNFISLESPIFTMIFE
jgi:hypothetical protein